jgi:hypothetical protein
MFSARLQGHGDSPQHSAAAFQRAPRTPSANPQAQQQPQPQQPQPQQ